MGKIEVMVADDNERILEMLMTAINEEKDMVVTHVAKDGLSAITYLEKQESCPDILVLDLVMPRLDGMGVLEKMQHFNKKPKVIMLTAFEQSDVTQRAVQLGVSYYMVKPLNLKMFIEQIRSVSKIDAITFNSTPIETSKQVAVNNNVETLISNFLFEVGIPAHIKGYHYLRQAVKMVYENFNLTGEITKTLYPTIAQQFKTTSSRTERAMRHAIDLAWTKGKLGQMEGKYGHAISSIKTKPTNGEFIAMIADKLRLDQRKE